jgi:hypothetical protein
VQQSSSNEIVEKVPFWHFHRKAILENKGRLFASLGGLWLTRGDFTKA